MFIICPRMRREFPTSTGVVGERDLVPGKEGEARAKGRSGEIKERDA